MTRLAWLHCLAGASGDMFLGALVDAGAPVESMQAAIDAVGVEPALLSVGTVERAGLPATRVEVGVAPSDVVRTWANLRSLLEDADLDDAVRRTALDAFARLAGAEAQAHRISPEQVHFHEVGALDAVADVVGSAAGLHALALDRVTASTVTVGSGMVRSAHGLLPVPAPAVLNLLADAGAPVQSGPAAYEMCTPTGAALLAATVTGWGDLPPMRVTAVGTGAGDRDLDELPNVLRIIVGDAVGPDERRAGPPLDAAVVVEAVVVEAVVVEAVVIEANVDDLDPRLWPAVLARLLAAGAADAWLTPILMKKGRPAHTLGVLVAPEKVAAVRRLIVTETSTIGVRETPVTKWALGRDVSTVTVGGEPVRIKTASLDGAVVNAAPEYDDVAAAAQRLGRPVKSVLAAAMAAAAAAGLVP